MTALSDTTEESSFDIVSFDACDEDIDSTPVVYLEADRPVSIDCLSKPRDEAKHTAGDSSSSVPLFQSIGDLSTFEKCCVAADSAVNGKMNQDICKGDYGGWPLYDTTHESPAVHWIMLTWKTPVLISHVWLYWTGEPPDSFDLRTRQSYLDDWETVAKASSPNMKTLHWGQCITGTGPRMQRHSIDIPFSKLAKNLLVFCHGPAPMSLRHLIVGGYEESTVPSAFLTPPSLLTDFPDLVSVSSSDPGERHLTIKNILAAGVDYSKDRWVVSPQNVGGGVWVRVDFAQHVLMTKVVLDWSGEYADDYELQVGATDDWTTIRQSPDKNNIGVETTGKLPEKDGFLHHVHTIKTPMTHQPTRSLRLFIRSPATEWGLSLWQIRVYGYKL
jgi:F5/8 type C domain